MKSMKRTLVILSILFMIFGCNDKRKSKDNSLSNMNLNGNVKSIKSVSYKAVLDENQIPQKGEKKNRERIHHSSLNRLSNLSEKGNLLSTVNSTSKGVIQFTTANVYNLEGINDEINFYDSEGNHSVKAILLVGKNYKPIVDLLYSKYGGLTRKDSLFYDNEGNRIEKKSYELNQLRNIWRYEYDKQGRATTELIYVNKDNLLNKYSYLYDKNGNVIELIKHDGDGNLVFHLKYELEFDEKNNWIRRIEYNENVAEFIIERDITYY